MIDFRTLILTVAALSCSIQSTLAQSCNCVLVTRYSFTGVPETPQQYSFGANISTTVGNNHSKVVIRADPTSGAIGKVTVNGDSDNIVWVLVTTDTNQGNVGEPPAGGSSWAGLDDNRGYLKVRAGITSNLTSDIYLNDTSDIQFLRVDGAIQDHVRIGGSNSTTSTKVKAGSISTAGDILKLNNRLESVQVTTGNALGDIEVSNGSIGAINVDNGDLGSATNFVTIGASAAGSGGYHIERIVALRHAYANIDLNTSTATTDDGAINIFQVGPTISQSTYGDFFGSLRMGTYAYEHFYIGRDLYGTIEIGSDLPAAATNGNPKRLLIGRNFKSGAQVTLPDNGLHGYVKVSRMLPGQGQWESGATVTIGSTTLPGPNYSNSFSSLGGGAVGVAPFRLHNSACTPANGATELVAGSSISSVRLRHYGPLNALTTTPVSISRRPLCSTGSYTSVSGATFNVDDDNPSATEPNCTLVVNLAFQVGYQYKITPNSSLQCWGADNVSVQWDSDYVINIRTACFADVTQDGVINVQDLLAVINAWGTCSGCPADLVSHPCGDGLVNVQDLLAVINGWGMECSTFEFGDAGSLESVQDCMDKCGLAYTPYSQDWNTCVNACVEALCEAGKIPCD